jgi:hypothetical protein
MRRLPIPTRRLKSNGRLFVPSGLLDALEAKRQTMGAGRDGGMLVG